MSFYSSLLLARNASPPAVSASDIGGFLRKLAVTGGLENEDTLSCKIKYGSSIDVDELSTEVVEQSGLITVFKEYPWDRDDTFTSIESMADSLSSDTRSVYRAYLQIGSLHDDITSVLTREPCEDNDCPLYLTNASFEIGPVEAYALSCQETASVGWMALHFSGPGYFYPWTYRQARERVESVERAQQLAKVCRQTWPVLPAPPAPEVIENRQQLEDLWLYDDIAKPNGWLWFVAESG